ncbi:UNVERIFIED_CONTAM: Retrovirus-related Pol polyprotein from transposon [Sesamum indicum]
MCTDFTDLNKACPKDPYPLPRIDVLVDSTARYEIFSMMDAYQGYHQIYMAKVDRYKTSFITHGGIYYYNVMPFGLKNADVTYQRLVNKMFSELIRRTMEVYVDDMLVKSKRSDNHLEHLKQAFTIMMSYGMKLNPNKCTFRVSGGTFLGYMVSERRIEPNPEKIEAIMGLRSQATIKEDNKSYLMKPPLLANPKEGEVLFLYLAVSENTVSSVLVREFEGIQNPIYYVSKLLQGAKKRYSEMEKLALALVVTARKLRPYFESHKIIVLTNYPLKYVMSRPEASGRLVKWAIELGEYYIDYQARVTQKAQVLVDFMIELAGNPIKEQNNKWMLHMDGSSNASKGEAGIWIQGPEGAEIEVAAKLSFRITNNEVEYEALILGLELEYEARARNLEAAKTWMDKFDNCAIQQIPRYENDKADALSKFGATMAGIKDRRITTIIRDKTVITESLNVEMVCESKSWKDAIVKYLENGILPDDPILAKRIKFKVEYVMKEVHEGCCGNHSGARLLAQKIMRRGYFWPTIVKVAREFVKRYDSCQRYASLIHQPATSMEPIKIACPFDQWGIDILGPFHPAQAHKKFIISIGFGQWNSISRRITKWCKELKIAQHFTAVGNPQVNGQTEVTNRTILQHLKTQIVAKGSWVEELPGVLWAYRTTLQTATGETPFCLVYETEAIIHIKMGEESQRVMTYDSETNQDERSFDLITIEERRDMAYARIMHHKGMMMKNYNRKVKPRQLQVEDLVLKIVEVTCHVGKLDPAWEGPYKVIEIKKRGTYKLKDMQRQKLPRPYNIHNLKKFYA